MPKNLCMCINFSKPGVLSKPFPILSRWNEGSSEKKTGTSCLLTESQPFYLLLSTSPAVNIFAGSKTETHGRDIEKNEIKTVPENLGHMIIHTILSILDVEAVSFKSGQEKRKKKYKEGKLFLKKKKKI